MSTQPIHTVPTPFTSSTHSPMLQTEYPHCLHCQIHSAQHLLPHQTIKITIEKTRSHQCILYTLMKRKDH